MNNRNNQLGVIHSPVLLQEAIQYLAIRPDGVYVDCTLGDGGYSLEILSNLKSGRLVSIDVDPVAIDFVKKNTQWETNKSRWTIVKENFAHIQSILTAEGISSVDGIVFDLGLSSRQIDADPLRRGFSFLKDEPLDMRMDPELGVTAEDLLKALSETQIADIFFQLGEERYAKRIAKAVREWIREHPDEQCTADGLAALVRRIIPAAYRNESRHPARRVFQALRIAVNDELRNLQQGMTSALAIVAIGGRVVVVSYHSLEDRIVKNAFNESVTEGSFELLMKKPVRAVEPEIDRNPRAHSAKLRAVRRIR